MSMIKKSQKINVATMFGNSNHNIFKRNRKK